MNIKNAELEAYDHTIAHSLKTPLAAIRAVLSEQRGGSESTRIEEQIERMNDIVRQANAQLTIAAGRLDAAAVVALQQQKEDGLLFKVKKRDELFVISREMR